MSQTPAGHPTWIDLATHDLDDAQRFYAEAFGWTFEDQGEDFGGYRMVRLGDTFVGGAVSSMQSDGQPTQTPQMPTSWTVYLAVDDVDEALGRVNRAGGTILMPGMQVGEAGRMALVSDPAGAVVGMWQAGAFPGLQTTGERGTPVWFETMSTDFDKSLSFYREVFGWEIHLMGPEDAPVRYATNGEGEQAVCGICDAASFLGDAQSFWRAYLLVPQTDEATARIQQLGGRLVDGPMDSPFGRLATVTDPQGATFQVIQPAS